LLDAVWRADQSVVCFPAGRPGCCVLPSGQTRLLCAFQRADPVAVRCLAGRLGCCTLVGRQAWVLCNAWRAAPVVVGCLAGRPVPCSGACYLSGRALSAGRPWAAESARLRHAFRLADVSGGCCMLVSGGCSMLVVGQIWCSGVVRCSMPTLSSRVARAGCMSTSAMVLLNGSRGIGAVLSLP